MKALPALVTIFVLLGTATLFAEPEEETPTLRVVVLQARTGTR